MLKEGSFCRFIEKAAGHIVRFTGVAIFGVLTVAAFISSQYMLPYGEELPMNKLDFPLWQILAVAVVLVIILGLSKYGENLKHKDRFEKILLAASMLFVFVCGILWIKSLNRVPEGDQAYLYAGASYFMEGDFSFFRRSSQSRD